MIRSFTESGLWIAGGWTMLHFLWVGCGVGLLAVMGRLLLRSGTPNVRYLFALTCLLALAASPVGIAVWIWETPPPADGPVHVPSPVLSSADISVQRSFGNVVPSPVALVSVVPKYAEKAGCKGIVRSPAAVIINVSLVPSADP